MDQGFFKILILIIIFIFLGILAYRWIKIPCSLPYLTQCQSNQDCLSQAKCALGQGIICFPQCKIEGFDFQCLKDKCIWSEKGIIPL